MTFYWHYFSCFSLRFSFFTYNLKNLIKSWGQCPLHPFLRDAPVQCLVRIPGRGEAITAAPQLNSAVQICD